MVNRKILHIDMDCFYAAVEVRDNPRLRGLPVAVGGSPEGRGVLTTASYEARKFGVHSAMSTRLALKLCPNLILVPPHFDKYKTESRKIRQIFARFTELYEPLSLDEAYLDVSQNTQFSGSATHIAQEIRKQIYQETQLTASAGIAPNKFLAKVASDWQKPNGQFTVTPQMIDVFVKQLPVGKIPGVGKVTAEKMHALGIKTCNELQKWTIDQLSHRFGVWGVRLYDLCRGKDDREVSNERVQKSLSVENTYAQDLTTLQDCLSKTPELFQEFLRRFARSRVQDKVKGLVVKLKFHDFQQTTLERTDIKEPNLKTYQEMIESAYLRGGKPVRLLGLGVKLLGEKKQAETSQLRFF